MCIFNQTVSFNLPDPITMTSSTEKENQSKVLKTIGAKVPEETYMRFHNLAKTKSKTPSELLRNMVDKQLSEPEAQQPSCLNNTTVALPGDQSKKQDQMPENTSQTQFAFDFIMQQFQKLSKNKTAEATAFSITLVIFVIFFKK
jgi:hypothetical protein